MKFKYRIHDLRIEKNMSGEELGRAVGLSRFAISGWENEKSYPSVEICLKLCDLFGCSLDYLLGRSDVREGNVPNADLDHLLNSFCKLSEDDKKTVIRFADFLKSNY